MSTKSNPDMAVNLISSLNLNEILNQVIHQGLTQHKKVNSKAALPAKVSAEKLDKNHKKGAIFAVRKKADFTEQGVKGYIITSKETLLEDNNQLSHFTPNIYRKFTYSDKTRRYITGFEEKNLLQINTFVVDIDTKRYSVQELQLACLDESIGLPTWIIESDRGYQLYFVLDIPLFISNKNDFRGLRVAKRIATNLKRSLQCVEADLYCNDFGFFRVPKPSNIVSLQLDHTYTINQLINWSMRQDDDIQRPLFVVHTTSRTKVDITRTDWFEALVESVDTKGKKGKIGRNNMLFTLALVCLQAGWSKERTLDFLDEYNSRLHYPLKGATVNVITESAYSGKYNGPATEYVQDLLTTYVPNKKFDVKLGGNGWYKFKKAREDRQNSHYDEWEQDIQNYLTAKFNVSEPFIWRTQKQLCEAIGIPQSSLNVLINQSNIILKTVVGKGRHSKTGWTTLALFMKHVLYEMQQTKLNYKRFLQSIMEDQLCDVIISPAREKAYEFINQLQEKVARLYGEKYFYSSG